MNIYLSMVRTNEMDDKIPPYSLLVLAAVVENMGHRVKIIFPFELAEFLKQPENLADCDIFGLSANSFNWYETRQVITQIHRWKPQIRIVLGGAHPTFFHDHCLKTTSAQAVVRNEGEVTFPEFIRAVATHAPLSEIQGITYKTETGEIMVNASRPLLTSRELGDMPDPAYHLIPPDHYPFIPVETSRGCIHSCIFCGIPYHKGLRLIPVEKVVRILTGLNCLSDRFTKNSIFFTDDCFTANKHHTIDVLEAVRQVVPSVSIACESRITDFIDHDLVPYFEKMNIALIQVGVECGYDEGLKMTRKHMTIGQILSFARRCVSTSFHYNLYWSFLIGLPWEKESHVIRTINFAYSCAAHCRSRQPRINNFVLFPGSDLFNNGERYGIPNISADFYDNPEWHEEFLIHTLIPPANREFIHQYLQQRHQSHPNFSWVPFLQLPNGKILDNRPLSKPAPL
ncbi:MAG: B12-binding domain-containing radical SAM protein [Candidatus Omnitrophota bacterium]